MMQTVRAVTFVFVFLTLALAGRSARAETEQGFQMWSALFAQTQTQGSGLVGWFDLHARRSAPNTVGIVRPALGWQFQPGLVAHLGYAWIPTFIEGASDTHEHRVWQQLLWSLRIGQGGQVALRPRFEQRFSGRGDDTGYRVRLFGRAQWVPADASGGHANIMLVAWDEAFHQVNDTDWGPVSGFDQNRLFLGVGFPTQTGPRFEVGYLNVYLNRSPSNRLEHVLAFNVFHTL